jgi:hypothetical protein
MQEPELLTVKADTTWSLGWCVVGRRIIIDTTDDNSEQTEAFLRTFAAYMIATADRIKLARDATLLA